jgi:hypothetical protein
MINQVLVKALALLLATTAACESSKLAGGDGSSGGRSGAGGGGQTGGVGGAVAFDAGADAGYANQLAAAQAAWAAAKPSCPIYRYQSRRTSVFGFCATTTIEIANDEAISRSFFDGTGSCEAGSDAAGLEQWSETSAAVGTHTDGDPARTVEQLIAACGQILASDRSKYDLFYQTGANGVPSACHARLINCADDCTDGLDIPFFTCERPD